jgi:DNA-directed RNA polymerase II subunit RPB2
LHDIEDQRYYHIGECPYDSGGYFIVKGSEKVLIAQERMAFNQVYVFKKSAAFNYFATVTSHIEKSGRLSEMEVRMYPKAIGGAAVRVHSLDCR